MTFNEYQNFAETTALYPDAGRSTIGGLAYCALGLAGESGEIADKVKKVIRDKGGIISDESRLEIAKECSDVAWYLARTASELGYTFQEIAQMNIDKLSSRKARGVIMGSGDNR